MAPKGIDPTLPNAARIYDYFLGGRENFEADRVAAREILAALPGAQRSARLNRAFLRRVVRFLARDAGVRQFIDVGAGLPTQGTVHEVAQAAIGDDAVKVVYVDHDPVVLAHAQALLVDPHTVAIQADLRTPGTILADPQLRRLIDFTEPVGLLCLATLHFIPEENDPYALIGRLCDALPSGSHLAVSHAVPRDPEGRQRAAKVYEKAGTSVHGRGPDQILRFFQGFDLVDPGLVLLRRWRPDGAEEPADPSSEMALGVVGRKP